MDFQQNQEPRLSNLRVSINTQAQLKKKAERLKIIRDLFNEIDRDKNHMLSFEEFYRFLSVKNSKSTGEDFDQALFKELFAKMDKNHDSLVSIDEFTESYADAEWLMKQRINEIKREVAEHMSSQESYKRRLI